MGEREEFPRSTGDYSLLRELGRGAMGVVYEARENATGRLVALKVIDAEIRGDAEAWERFRQEAVLAARLSHPNAVFVYGLTEVDSAPAIAMELVRGGTLQQRIEQAEPVPLADALQWALQILDGLQAMHGAGFLHRDLKPGNCLLEGQTIKVGDFGLARDLVRHAEMTQAGRFVGTAHYAPPEQLRGERVGVAADVYAAAATIHAILTGMPPFPGRTYEECIARTLTETPAAVTTLRPDVPQGIAELIRRGLAKNPSHRFQSCAEFRDALAAQIQGVRSIAPMSVRFCAWLIDALWSWPVILLLNGILSRWWPGIDLGDLSRQGPGVVAAAILMSAAYYTATTAWLGAAVGQWILGIRVVSDANFRPGLVRIVVRVLLYPGLPMVADAIGSHLLSEDAAWALAVLYLSPLLSWRGGRLVGWHEQWSGTRTVRRTRHVAPLFVPLQRPLSTRKEFWGAIEGLEIRRSIAMEEEACAGQLLVARDVGLSRDVLLYRGPLRESERGAAELSLECELRWLGRRSLRGDPRFEFDCFEYPGGAPVIDYERHRKCLPWHVARRAMLDLARYLEAGGAPVRPADIWIDSVGRLRITRFARQPTGEGPVTEALRRASLRVCSENLAATEYRPLHSDPALKWIAEDRADDSIACIRAAIEGIQSLPSHIDGAALRKHFAAGVLVPAVFVGFLVWAGWDAACEAGIYAPSAISKVMGIGLAVVVTSLCAAAYVTRGAPAWSLAGVGLRRTGGQRASRARCAWRTLLAWSPWLGLAAVMMFAHEAHRASSAAPHSSAPFVAIVMILKAVGPKLLAVAAGMAVAIRDRLPTLIWSLLGMGGKVAEAGWLGPVDVLAGTYLVPK